MSEPYIPGLEEGTSLDGNIELSAEDLKSVTYVKDNNFEQSSITRCELSDFGDGGFLLKYVLTSAECDSIIENGEKLGFETIRGVRDDYRSCKR